MATFDQRKFQFFKEREERSILIKIRLQLYEISTEVLLEVFSTCGNIETVEIFRSGEEFHSKVCFEDQDSTIRALDWYNDRYIYGRCFQLELFQASQFIDRSSKIKVPTQEVEDVLEIPAMPEIGERQSRAEEIPIKGDDIQIAQDSPRSFNRNFKAPSESVLGDSGVDLIANEVSKFETPNQKVFEDERSTQTLDFAMVDDSRDWKVEVDAPVADLSHVGAPIANADLEIQIQFGSEMDDVKKPPNPEIPEPSKVNSDPSETPPVDYTTEKLGELVVLLIELMEIRLESAKKISRTGLTGDSVDSLGKLGAHKVFVKMPKKSVHVMAGLRVDQWPSNLVSFGMRSVSLGIELSQEFIKVPYDRGKSAVDEHRINKGNLNFYPGGVDNGSCRSDVGLVLVVHPAWDVSMMGQSSSGHGIDLTLLRDGLKSLPFDRGQTGLSEESMSCCLDSSKGGFYGLDVDTDGSGGINIKPSYDQRSCISVDEIANSDLKFIRNGQSALPFDRGKISSDVLKAQMDFWKVVFALKDVVLVFDPGIIECLGQLGKSSIGSEKAIIGCWVVW